MESPDICLPAGPADRSRRWMLRGATVGVAAVGGAIAMQAPEANATTTTGIAGWLNVQD